jgi:hypothetical protein
MKAALVISLLFFQLSAYSMMPPQRQTQYFGCIFENVPGVVAPVKGIFINYFSYWYDESISTQIVRNDNKVLKTMQCKAHEDSYKEEGRLFNCGEDQLLFDFSKAAGSWTSAGKIYPLKCLIL